MKGDQGKKTNKTGILMEDLDEKKNWKNFTSKMRNGRKKELKNNGIQNVESKI